MSRNLARLAAVLLPLVLIAAACGNDSGGSGKGDGGGATATTAPAKKIDYSSIGLWDDGACDQSKPPLKIGQMVVFESPVISLKDQADALKAAATAFNKRGGANGSCIQVHLCDDGAQVDQSIACVKEIDQAGVVATVNDQGTAGQADVAEAMRKAGIPRVAGNVTNNDWADPNAYPMDASGTGVTFLMPEALLARDIKDIGDIRVDLPEAAALPTLLGTVYKDDGVKFKYDAPVPAGTTDFSQFILGAQQAGVHGVILPLGEQEAVQVVKAGQQLGTTIVLGNSLGTFSHSNIAELGDFAKQMSFVGSFPPATTELPVYEALRADLAASGEKALQPDNLKTSPMRSWIGLYALLYMIRQAKPTDFSRANITAMLQSAKDVPMLGMYGDENWTPNLDHKGLWTRAGMNHWAIFSWDAKAKSPVGTGNFVQKKDLNWDAVLCGSAFGSSGPC
jgi:ABC-type branched-subunit amino acid transport system substrate-binding protein